METSSESVVLKISVRIYRLFLLAYPADFQRTFGPHMAQLFRDAGRDAFHRAGTPGVLLLWAPTLLDLLVTALEQHILERFHLPRSKMTGWGGLAILVASALGILSIVSLQAGLSPSPGSQAGGAFPIYPYARYLFMLAGLLLVLGLTSLMVGYSQQAGSLGRAGLVISVLGLGVGGVGISLLYFAHLAPPWREWAWYSYGLGCLLLHLGIALFGLAALHRRILSWGNVLPLIVGLPLPIIVALSGWTINDFPVMGLGWILLGYVFFTDASQRSLPA